MNTPKPYPHLVRKADIAAKELSFSHPWNPKSQVIGTMLARLGGLARTGVSLVRIPKKGPESLFV